jgi:predicted phage tail protein
MKNMKKKIIASFVAGVIMVTVAVGAIVTVAGVGGLLSPAAVSAESRDDDGGG